jgi:hypothetical protein
MEQAYHAALPAFQLLGKPEALGVMHSPDITARMMCRPQWIGWIISSADLRKSGE